MLCASCWDLRSHHVAQVSKPSNLGTTGLVLGLCSLIPLAPLQVASLVVNIIALAKARPGEHTKPLIGLVATLVGCGGLVALVFASSFAQ